VALLADGRGVMLPTRPPSSVAALLVAAGETDGKPGEGYSPQMPYAFPLGRTTSDAAGSSASIAPPTIVAAALLDGYFDPALAILQNTRHTWTGFVAALIAPVAFDCLFFIRCCPPRHLSLLLGVWKRTRL